MEDFYRIKRLPPYVFSIVDELKMKAAELVQLGLGLPKFINTETIKTQLMEIGYSRDDRHHRVGRTVRVDHRLGRHGRGKRARTATGRRQKIAERNSRTRRP
jgi:hypothetical protein